MHTPNGNIPIVARYLRQSGLLLDHPSSVWDPLRISKYLYSNPHNPPPGGYARELGLGSRVNHAGPTANRWSAPGVASKSVEVQRSQVDEVFKSLKNGEELQETEPSKPYLLRIGIDGVFSLFFRFKHRNRSIPSSEEGVDVFA